MPSQDVQRVSFQVPLFRRMQELTFNVGKTVLEREECIKWKLTTDDMGNEFVMLMVLRDELETLEHQEAIEEEVNNEIAVLKLLDHPNVLKLFQVFSTESIVYVLVERRPIPLSSVLARGPLSEPHALALARQLVSGLAHLHSKGLAHRNVSPENILLSEDEQCLCIGGAGFAVCQDPGTLTNDHPARVDPLYSAPEVREKEGEYDAFLCDAWSLGCVLYAMFNGKDPPTDAEGAVGECPSEVREILQDAIVKNAWKRRSLQEITQHQWFVGDGSVSPRFNRDQPLNRLAVRKSFSHVSSSLQLDHRRVSCRMNREASITDDGFSPETRVMPIQNALLLSTLSPAEEVPGPPTFCLSPGGQGRQARPQGEDVFGEKQDGGGALVSPMNKKKPGLKLSAVPPLVAPWLESAQWLSLSVDQQLWAEKAPELLLEQWLIGDEIEGAAPPPPDSVQKQCAATAGERREAKDGSSVVVVRVMRVEGEDECEPWVSGQVITIGSLPLSTTVRELARRVQQAEGIPARRQLYSTSTVDSTASEWTLGGLGLE
eukprot:Hpha_TRINITY_DN15820_c0_g2::TRINITY_DN15820_c0_g2_i1::g.187118::m.187118